MRSPCQEQTGISGGEGGQAHFSFILGNASCAHSVPRWRSGAFFFHFGQHELRTLRVRNMRSDPVVSEPVKARIRRVISSVSGNVSCAHFVSRWTDPAVVSKPVEARIRRVISSVSGVSCAHFVSRWTDPVTAREPVEVVIRRVIFLPFPA